MFRIFSQYVAAKTLLLMAVEGLLVGLALVCAAKLRFWNDSSEFASYTVFPDFALESSIVIIVCLACFYYNDLYDLREQKASAECALRIEQSSGAACLLLGLLYFLLPGLLMSRGVFLIGMILTTAFVAANRKFLDRTWQMTTPLRRVLILGTGQLASEIALEMKRRDDLNLEVVGFVSASREEAEGLFGFPIVGGTEQLETMTHQYGISRIIVALDGPGSELPLKELISLKVHGVCVDDGPSALSALTGRIALRTVKSSWFLFSSGFHRSKWNELLKRVLDMTAGVVGLLISVPLMAVIAQLIRLESRGPVIYRQTRVGYMGRYFEVLKFRSMRVDAEQVSGAQWAVENDPRVTRVGRVLRKYRLDELPQFVNVIRGEMSFVGPRPERPIFVENLREAIPFYDERHSVRPGLTGWAQVQYNYGGSVEGALGKLEYDLFYLQNMSLTFDLAIILKTIRIVIGGHGAR